MGSPLGPVLAGIFMVELERTILPTLREHMSPWKRYVDDTISYIKEVQTMTYLHWQSFCPTAWKRVTLQTLVSRVFKVCSNDQLLQNEIKNLKKVFRDINGYPNWIIEQTIEKVKNQNEMTRSTQVTTNTKENKNLIMLPYKGKVGETTLKSLGNTLKSVIPANKLSILERSYFKI